MLISRLEPDALAVGVDDFHRRFDVRSDAYCVGFLTKIDHNLLDRVRRSRFTRIVGKTENSVVAGGANDEGI